MSDIFKQEDAEVQKTDVSVYIDAIDNDAAFRIIDLSEKMHTVPKTKKEKDLAAMGHPKDKITHKDVLIGRGVLSKEEEDRIAEKANTLGLDEQKIKVGDYVKDQRGTIHRVFDVQGTTLHTGEYQGKDGYGGQRAFHMTKVTKVPKPKDVNEEAELDEGSKHAARPRSASRPGTEPAKKGSLQDRIMAARQRMDAKKKVVAEGGPFSYGAKKPRKGSAADLADKKRREQERGRQPIEPKDQMVGTAKVTKGVKEETEQVDEISMDYLRKKDYLHKAEVSRKDAENVTRQYWKSADEKKKARETADKRDKGIGAYTDRLYKTMKKPEYKSNNPMNSYPLGGRDEKSGRSYSEEFEPTMEDMHYCAKHVFSERFGEGLVVEGSHAEPDESGLIEWYDVDFGGTIRRVMTERVKVMYAEYHMNHKRKKMSEEDDEQAHTTPMTKKEKELAAMGHPKDKITHKDVLIGRGVIAAEATQQDKDELQSRAVEGRKRMNQTMAAMDQMPKSVSGGEKGKKNVEQGFRSALKRAYKKADMAEEFELNESLSDWEEKHKKMGCAITRDKKTGNYHAWQGTKHISTYSTQKE